MKLYCSHNSPYARKVRVVLAELGIAYEPILTDVNHLPPDYARANPNLRIPCLLDGERTLFESNVIVDYLLGRGSAPAGPPPPLARTMTRPSHDLEERLVLATIDTLLDSGLNLFVLSRDGIRPEQSGTLRRELRRMQAELDWLETRVTPQGFVPGVFSIQDLNLTIALLWLDFRQPLPWRGQGRPRLEALVERYRERPSLLATQPVP
jgi:glutathione S-transferase